MVPDERTPDKRGGGTAIHEALPTIAATAASAAASAARTASDSWKKWRDVGAFGFLIFIVWQGYKDFVRTTQDNMTRLEVAINAQMGALNGLRSDNNLLLQTLQHSNESHMNRTATMFIQSQEMVKQMRDEAAQDRKAMQKFVTVLERIDRKLPADQGPVADDRP